VPRGERNSTRSRIDSAADAPVLGAGTVFFAGFGRGIDSDGRGRCFRGTDSTYSSKVMLVIGWTSQIIGMRLFKLWGPGREPVA